MIDFTLIILCKERSHLLPLTLDTLKAQKGGFEVLLLDGEKGGALSQLSAQYPELSIRIQNVSGKTIPEMMNEGLELSEGRYIQFLEPGDRYISQHGLEFLSTLIGSHPHLVYANSLNREGHASSDFITARSPWFLKEKLVELGGFDPRLKKCPAMDLLCRLFRDQKTQSVFCRRVLLDTNVPPSIPIRETCRILYRHFGLWQAVKWVFFQDRSRWFHRAALFFKEAFWRNDDN